MTDALQLWESCAEEIRAQVSDGVWNTTFKETRAASVSDNEIVLTVPNQWVKDRIEGRYLQLVRGVLDDMADTPVNLLIEVETKAADDVVDISDNVPGDAVVDLRIEYPAAPSPSSGPVNNSVTRSLLNPRYSFESFVTGTSNRFAQAAALSVAERPSRSYNPLFIHGHAGLGKTHLLQAIGNYVRENYSSHTVQYVSTETFMNDFVEAIRTNQRAEFKRRYREIDVLLVDDIQFLEGKEGLQEEFFHTFNSLYQANKQIVLSSDRPPDAMSTLEDRLRSRFKMGLITDIQPPDLETRHAILRRKAESESMPVPHDVVDFIAHLVKNNIRELEGALIRVCAYASLNDQPLTVELAHLVLSDLVNSGKGRPITAGLIIDATSEMFQFSRDEIIGQRRQRPLVTARQIAMYLIREMTDLSYPAIAREFGGRDHTTVIHAVEKITKLMSERRAIYEQVTELTQRIKEDRG